MKIFVRLKKSAKRSYQIHVESGIFKKIPLILKKAGIGEHAIIITDENVKKLYGKTLLENLRKTGFKASLISFPASETSKSWKTISEICEKMAEIGAKRDSFIIALGGGVSGDIGGFVAAIYMRGIPYVQVPTTLLAMVDSSIGGKTGIDLECGKNLVGAFYQPKMVFIDPELLKKLPKKELKNGLAEIVKHAVVASRSLFLTIAKNIGKFDSIPLLEKIIIQNVKIKMKFVENDEKESIGKKSGSRMALNYGHTIGHAVEKLENYKISHGEAVSIGMVLENRMAVNKKMLSEKEVLLIKNLLSKLGLPTKLPANISLKSLEQAIKADKKIIGGKIYFALPKKIGRVKIVAI